MEGQRSLGSGKVLKRHGTFEGFVLSVDVEDRVMKQRISNLKFKAAQERLIEYRFLLLAILSCVTCVG